MFVRPAILSSRLLISNEVVNLTTRRQYGFGFLFKWLGTDTLIWLQQPLDLTINGIMARIKKKQWKQLVDSQKIKQETREYLGDELAAAEFIMDNGGSVKFKGALRWYKKKENEEASRLPISPLKMTIEAIDASGTKIMYESFKNLGNLENIRYLDLSDCKYIDDWCLDHLSTLRSSLTVLNLSNCHRVTDNGLACLHRLKKLQRLVLKNMSGIKNPQLSLMMLEEVLPECFIEGVSYESTDNDQAIDAGEQNDGRIANAHQPNLFLDNWEKQALSEDNELANSLKNIAENKS